MNVIDLDAPEEGDGAAAAAAFGQGMTDYGYGATVVTASRHREAAAAAAAGPLVARVELEYFVLTTGSIEIGDEEYYMATAAGADGGTRRPMKTRLYENVWSDGKHHSFDPNTVVYQGGVNKVLIFNIQPWEYDGAASPDLVRTLDKISVMAWEVAQALGHFPAGQHLELTQGFANLVSGLANLIGQIIDWFADDLVQERTFLFDRPALESMLSSGARSDRWTFDGRSKNNGRVDVRVASSVRVLPSLTMSSFNGQSWSPFPVNFDVRTPSTPALAIQGDRLYVAAEGGDGSYHIAHIANSTWSPWAKMSAFTPGRSAPALAAHQNQLYLVHRTDDNHLWGYWSVDGVTWHLLGLPLPGTTRDAPSLASTGSELWCAVRGVGDHRIFISKKQGNLWSEFVPHPQAGTNWTPALACVQGKMVLAWTTPDGTVYTSESTGQSWSNAVPVGGTTTASGPSSLPRTTACTAPSSAWTNRSGPPVAPAPAPPHSGRASHPPPAPPPPTHPPWPHRAAASISPTPPELPRPTQTKAAYRTAPPLSGSGGALQGRVDVSGNPLFTFPCQTPWPRWSSVRLCQTQDQ